MPNYVNNCVHESLDHYHCMSTHALLKKPAPVYHIAGFFSGGGGGGGGVLNFVIFRVQFQA